jgi:flagellar operon protein
MVKGIYSVKQVQEQKPSVERSSKKVEQGNKFQTILQQQIQKDSPIRFSGHALERLKSREIVFDAECEKKLGEAMVKLAEKGGRESLVIMGDLALIVSVTNKTVITAINGENIRNNVFTNIDSAVIT